LVRADAYARWIGKRLPTEAEWEFAAAYDPQAVRSRTYPWGDLLRQERRRFEKGRWSPDPLCYPELGADEGPQASADRTINPFGLRARWGEVWEWTATPFLPYPGFEAFPYDGYSKDHMDGKHYVCRGGSWASASRILRCSFRNWYVPTYRQGFLGVRCAR